MLAWAGWTVLFGAVAASMLFLLPAGQIWGPLLAAVAVGALSGRWSFLLSPVAVGVAGLGLVAFESMRDRDSAFAVEAGYQIAALAVAVLTIGAILAAALGVVIGRFLRSPAPAPVNPTADVVGDAAKPPPDEVPLPPATAHPATRPQPSREDRQLVEDILSTPMPSDPDRRSSP